MGFKKLDDAMIETIRKLRMQGYSHEMICEKLGVSRPTCIKYSKGINPMTESEVEKIIDGGTMAKARFSVDKLLSKAAEEAVENAVEKRLEPEEQPVFISDEPLSGAEAFFGDGGEPSIIKVYKTINGVTRFLSEIEPEVFKGWEDFESGFRRYVVDRTAESRNVWGDGSYQVRFRDKVKRIELGGIAAPEKAVPVKPQTDDVEKLTSIIRALKEVLPLGGSGSNEGIYKTLLDSQEKKLDKLNDELKEMREKTSDLGVLDSVTKIMEKIPSALKGGDGGSSSIGVEIVRALAGNLGEITNLVKSTAETTRNILELHRRGLIGVPLKANTPEQPPLNPPTPALPPQYQNLFTELHGYIMSGDTGKFPEISRKLVAVFGGDDSILKGLAIGEITVQQACDMLKSYYGPFRDPSIETPLNNYMASFVNFLKGGPYKNFVEEFTNKNQVQPPQPSGQPSPYSDNTKPASSAPGDNASNNANVITVHCPQCNAVYDVDKADWAQDDKICGNRLLNGECQGRLEELPEA